VRDDQSIKARTIGRAVIAIVSYMSMAGPNTRSLPLCKTKASRLYRDSNVTPAI